jgi:hypothetical protein
MLVSVDGAFRHEHMRGHTNFIRYASTQSAVCIMMATRTVHVDCHHKCHKRSADRQWSISALLENQRSPLGPGGNTVSKFLASLALAGLLAVGLSSSSDALTFTVTQPSATAPAGADTFESGVTTNSGTPYTATLIQLIPVQNFLTDSSVSFGTTTQTGAPGSGTYTNVPANFSFDLTVPSVLLGGTATDSFQVQGLINGMTTFDPVLGGGSTAEFAPHTILINGVATPFLTGVTSPAGRLSDEISGLSLGGSKVDVFFDAIDALTAPGANSPLSVGGFIRATPAAATPEPGTWALLTGMGISGTMFLRRKRRA